jgi:predicted nucleotidyltransferase
MIVTDKMPQLVALCKKYRVATMYLFGSAANDNLNENSDIDFLISLSNPYFVSSVKQTKQLIYAN